MILPRFKSYGESATFTESPGTIRIKCFLIFPDKCARMICPFCNSTLNIVFGNASFTMPSTSIASSLATIPLQIELYSKFLFAFFQFNTYNLRVNLIFCQHIRNNTWKKNF